MNKIQKQKSNRQKLFALLLPRVGKQLLAICFLGLVTLGGCGAEGAPPASDTASVADSSGENASNSEANAKASDGAVAAGAPTNATAQLIQAASIVPRKIIYNATVDLIADNFSAAQGNLLSLIRKHKGYVAETNIDATTKAPREGTWKIRVPEDQFQPFMNAVVRLGELQTTHTDSQDVTAEFYDLQARISNKQVEEQRLLDHLKRSTAKLNDILIIEREISRVRGEIEQMQGRLRLLANMTSLTTITVTLHEVKGYVPPKPATFSTQIARSFQGSMTGLIDVCKGAVIAIVALLPWAVIFALIGFPVWRLTRRFSPKPPDPE